MGSVYGQQTLNRKRVVYKKAPPKAKFDETNLQIRIANYLKRYYPHVMFSSDGAGINKTRAQAGIWKAINSDKGAPDMTIHFPSRGYHGAFIELKKESPYKKNGELKRQMVKIKNKIGQPIGEYNHLEMQKNRLIELNKLGYYANFIWSYDMAVRFIDWYMCKPENKTLF